jgi:CIC family chloride channel protein
MCASRVDDAMMGTMPRSGHTATLLLAAAIVGGATGFAVAGFEWITRGVLLDRVLGAPVLVQAACLLVGLSVAVVAVRFLRAEAPSTADDYIVHFHDDSRGLHPRALPGKILGSIATLGLGGALGFEGPSLYVGAFIGSHLGQRSRGRFGSVDVRSLMVAGAAAGVAAIFKAPATGAVFALEVPYREDQARNSLLPALVGASCGYLAFALINGTGRLFAINGDPPFSFSEIGAALGLGLLCGLGARLMAMMIKSAKTVAARVPPVPRVALGSMILIALLWTADRIYGVDVGIGPGYNIVEWISSGDHAIGLIVLLFVIRLLATTTTLGAGGMGGLFVPLVIAGALTGDVFAVALGDHSNLYPVIGVAAFLGAGYRTPLAGVMFIAETTGRPGFIIPGLLATVAAQFLMGSSSVSPYQQGWDVERT